MCVGSIAVSMSAFQSQKPTVSDTFPFGIVKRADDPGSNPGRRMKEKWKMCGVNALKKSLQQT